MDDMLNKHVDQTEGAMIESAQALRLAGKAISVAREAREGLAVMRERLYARKAAIAVRRQQKQPERVQSTQNDENSQKQIWENQEKVQQELDLAEAERKVLLSYSRREKLNALDGIERT
jgi:hypothetical protein